MAGTRIRDNQAVDGAGIWSGGTLTVARSTISGNSNSSQLFAGGGLYNAGTAEVTASASGNNRNGVGAGIYNTGTLALTNVTISGNNAHDIGGGVNNVGSATFTNVTVADNVADDGSAIWHDGSATVVNSVLEIFPTDDVRPCQGVTSLGHNPSNRRACGLMGPGDILLDEGQLLLGPLADSGGPTQIHAVLAGSPAIDDGDNEACPTADQRGVGRPIDGNDDGVAVCDMGAYEAAEGTVIPPSPPILPSALPAPGGSPADGPSRSSSVWPLVALGGLIVAVSGLYMTNLRRS